MLSWLSRLRPRKREKSFIDRQIEEYTELLNSINHNILDNGNGKKIIYPRIYNIKNYLKAVDDILEDGYTEIPILREREMKVIDWLTERGSILDTSIIYHNFILNQKLIRLLELKKSNVKSKQLDLLITNLSHIVDTLNR